MHLPQGQGDDRAQGGADIPAKPYRISRLVGQMRARLSANVLA